MCKLRFVQKVSLTALSKNSMIGRRIKAIARGIMFSSDSTNVPSNFRVLVRVVKASISEELSSSPFRSRKLQKWWSRWAKRRRDAILRWGYAFDICRLPVYVTMAYCTNRFTANLRKTTDSCDEYLGFSHRCPETFFSRKLVPPSHTRLRIDIDRKWIQNSL